MTLIPLELFLRDSEADLSMERFMGRGMSMPKEPGYSAGDCKGAMEKRVVILLLV